MRPLLKNGLMSVGATALSLAAGEGVVRAVAPQPAEIQSLGMYVPDPHVGYRLTPGHEGYLGNRVEYFTRISINDYGLRGPLPSEDACALRVLVLGDSFVFGQGVDEHRSITADLARQLHRPGRPVEVLNAGVRGYGTRRQVAWLASHGAALEPEIVVLGVYLGNDVHDNLIPPADSSLRHGPHGFRASIRDNPATRWAYEHSHLYGLVRRAGRALTFARAGGGTRVDVEAAARTFGATDDSENDEAVRLTKSAVAEFGTVARSIGATPLAFMIPSPLQVEPEADSLLRAAAGEMLAFDLRWPNTVFAEAFTDADIVSIDLTSALAEQAAGDDLYYPIDGHWTERGHLLGARLVAPLVDSAIDTRASSPASTCVRAESHG